MTNTFLLGDCLELMQSIPDRSVDMVLCDPPYGMTGQAWDRVIPFDQMWAQYERIVKERAAIILFSSQPFSARLIMSRPKWFRHEWIWNKKIAGNFFLAKHQPLKIHENILVFSQRACRYYPIMRIGRDRWKGGGTSRLYKTVNERHRSNEYYPTSILEFQNAVRGQHVTSKPVPLCEYLIRSYSQPGDLILDNCAGLGTTAIAAINTGRNYICIEKDPEFYNTGLTRIEKHIKEAQNVGLSRTQETGRAD